MLRSLKYVNHKGNSRLKKKEKAALMPSKNKPDPHSLNSVVLEIIYWGHILCKLFQSTNQFYDVEYIRLAINIFLYVVVVFRLTTSPYFLMHIAGIGVLGGLFVCVCVGVGRGSECRRRFCVWVWLWFF